jgi:hypothetical protein
MSISCHLTRQALWLRIALLALHLEPSQNLPRLLRHDAPPAADERGGDAALRELVRRQALVVRCVDCPQLEAAGWSGIADAVDKLLAGVRDRRVLAAATDAASAGIVDHLLALVHTGRAQVYSVLAAARHSFSPSLSSYTLSYLARASLSRSRFPISLALPYLAPARAPPRASPPRAAPPRAWLP